MKINFKVVTLIFMIIVLNIGSVIADEISLNNGDRITGKLMRMEEGKLIFRTSYAGEISIKWGDVANVKTDESVNIVLSDETSLKGITKPSDDGKMKIKMGKIVETVSFNLKEVKSINPKPKVGGPIVKLKGHVNIGGTKNKGNTDKSDFHIDTELVTRTEKNRYTIGGEVNRAEDDDEKTADNVLVYMKYDHFLSKKWFFYNNAFFENDEFKDLKLRTAGGLGLGYQFLETRFANLSLESGFNYISKDYYDGEDENYSSGRWSLDFDRYLFEKTVQFFHFNEGFIGFEDINDIFIRSRTGFRLPVYKMFNTTVQYNFDWDNSPAPGRDKKDEMLLYTLGWKW
ncbi:MAG: DUF481 domain-containing protein [Thermodesulfobacteriota bacterium]|nr:DUF481 domain-containing protein [Thermodesulfobacteriota bacterium]